MKPFDEMQTNLRSWSGALQSRTDERRNLGGGPQDVGHHSTQSQS